MYAPELVGAAGDGSAEGRAGRSYPLGSEARRRPYPVGARQVSAVSAA
jgi:hypothetical protein